MIRALIALLLTTLATLAAAAPATKSLEARVIGVMDGDTVKVLDANKVEYKIRLAGIDAPEHDQPFGQRSKQSLSGAVMGKDVRIEWAKQDHYGRLVGKIWATPPELHCDARITTCPKTLDVNLAQLTVGLAWHYKEYEKEQTPEDRQRYAFAEQEARARKAGLWSEPDPTPPWDWRHGTAGGPIKKATSSGICHEPGTAGYSATKKFTKYPTLEACLASGGRLPKQSGH
jgi:endonuclease YncB( thermonuclease family)